MTNYQITALAWYCTWGALSVAGCLLLRARRGYRCQLFRSHCGSEAPQDRRILVRYRTVPYTCTAVHVVVCTGYSILRLFVIRIVWYARRYRTGTASTGTGTSTRPPAILLPIQIIHTYRTTDCYVPYVRTYIGFRRILAFALLWIPIDPLQQQRNGPNKCFE